MDAVLALSSKKKAQSLGRRIRREVTPVGTAEALFKRLTSDEPSLVIVDGALPSVKGMDREIVDRLRGWGHDVMVLLVDDLATFDPGKLSELLANPEQSDSRGRRKHARLEPGLHDPETGRIDAGRVARFFGLSLSKLARLLGRSPQAVHKTPCAEGLQDELGLFVRVASALTALFGSEERGRVWLNTPHPDLDNTRPLDLVERGLGETVAELLEDNLLGHPG